MAERPGPARLIPNWQMDKPWTTPMAPEEEEGMAETALLSGAPENERAISQLLSQFAGDFVLNLGNARG